MPKSFKIDNFTNNWKIKSIHFHWEPMMCQPGSVPYFIQYKIHYCLMHRWERENMANYTVMCSSLVYVLTERALLCLFTFIFHHIFLVYKSKRKPRWNQLSFWRLSQLCSQGHDSSRSDSSPTGWGVRVQPILLHAMPLRDSPCVQAARGADPEPCQPAEESDDSPRPNPASSFPFPRW